MCRLLKKIKSIVLVEKPSADDLNKVKAERPETDLDDGSSVELQFWRSLL